MVVIDVMMKLMIVAGEPQGIWMQYFPLRGGGGCGGGGDGGGGGGDGGGGGRGGGGGGDDDAFDN